MQQVGSAGDEYIRLFPPAVGLGDGPTVCPILIAAPFYGG